MDVFAAIFFLSALVSGDVITLTSGGGGGGGVASVPPASGPWQRATTTSGHPRPTGFIRPGGGGGDVATTARSPRIPGEGAVNHFSVWHALQYRLK